MGFIHDFNEPRGSHDALYHAWKSNAATLSLRNL